jgi:hypothetical protein
MEKGEDAMHMCNIQTRKGCRPRPIKYAALEMTMLRSLLFRTRIDIPVDAAQRLRYPCRSRMVRLEISNQGNAVTLIRPR